MRLQSIPRLKPGLIKVAAGCLMGLLSPLGLHGADAPTVTPEVGEGLPIKPARTIAFSTSEGTDMDVDLSPDGGMLVFDLLGDLYTVSVGGGVATQITHGLAYNQQPVWSPDGTKIACISDISGSWHVCIRDLSGGVHVLGKDRPQLNGFYARIPLIWTPDGSRIVAIDDNHDVDFEVASGASKLRVSQRLLCYSRDGVGWYYLDREKGLCRHDQNQGMDKTLVAASALPRGLEAISPDGRWLVCVRRPAPGDRDAPICLVVQELATGIERTLVSGLAHSDPGWSPRGFAFSSDGGIIFIAYGGKIHRIAIEDGADRVVPFTASASVELGPRNDNRFHATGEDFRVRATRSANESPDGSQLVYSALGQLYRAKLPEGKPELIAPQSVGQFQPAFSPDGRWIAYVTWSDAEGGAVWRVPSAGGEPQKLTGIPGQYQRPTWSPDGAWIAVVNGPLKWGSRDREGNGRLELVSTRSNPPKIIDPAVPLNNNLAFSGDGQRVIYMPSGAAERQAPFVANTQIVALLVSRVLDGSDRQVLAIGDADHGPQQIAMSPDGKFFTYTKAENMYLVPAGKADRLTTIFDPAAHELPVIRFAKGLDPHWEEGGKVLAWSYGATFFRARPEAIVALAKRAGRQIAMPDLPTDGAIEVNAPLDGAIDLSFMAPSFHARGNLALRGVRIITMGGAGVIEKGTVLVENGRVAAVGPDSRVGVPQGVKVLDLPGTTVVPGFIDLHLHLILQDDILPQQSWMYLANLAYGVTTARDPSSSYDSFGCTELLEAGKMIGPRLFSVGRAIGPGYGVLLNDASEAKFEVAKRTELGAVAIKQYANATRRQRQWLLEACRQAGVNMTNEGQSLTAEICQIKDGSTGVEHNPAWGNVYGDVVSLYSLSGTFFTPTLQVAPRGTESYFDRTHWHNPDTKLLRFTLSDPARPIVFANEPSSIEAIQNAEPGDGLLQKLRHYSEVDARIRHAGGRVTLGSHGQGHGIGTHNELWALQMGGLTNMEALQAATIMGAEALGMQQDLGSIEPGKIADLIVLNKNPLDDIHNSREIRYVMKDGVLYDGDTLAEEWPEIRPAPQWRLNPEPRKPGS